MDTKEIEKRFIDLETKFAYLEDYVQQLQGVVVEHTKTIDKLLTKNKLLEEKLTEVFESSGEIPNRKPPHY
jgi:uncharacterized coiled-coil protein SlyX